MRCWGELILVAFACGLAAGCTDDESWKVFRREASETIGQGIKTVFGGIVDGIVAVVDANDSSSSSANSSSSNATSKSAK